MQIGIIGAGAIGGTLARALVLKLIDDLGFDAVDGGALAESWRQHPGAAGYCRDFDRKSLAHSLEGADRSRIAALRAEADAAARAYVAALASANEVRP